MQNAEFADIVTVAFDIRHSAFVILHSSFCIRHSAFVILHSPFFASPPPAVGGYFARSIQR
jgi:hypothetical protein